MSGLELLAILLGFGAPTLAMAHWGARSGGQAVEILTAGLSGAVLVLPALWISSSLLGIGPLAALVAGLVTAGLIDRRASQSRSALASSRARSTSAPNSGMRR